MAEPAGPDPAEPSAHTRRAGRIGTGPGRLLVAVYGLFALSATARAGVQIATRLSHAPLSYLLSALSGVIYIVATVALATGHRRLALASIGTELLGVLGVGTASLVEPSAFPDASVWSTFGAGYGFVPLVLPVLGLLWLRRHGRAAATPAAQPAAGPEPAAGPDRGKA